MPRGPARLAAVGALRGIDLAVVAAGNAYEGAARFAETPADLVVASLEGWRRRDLAFLTAVRSRSPGTTVVVLTTERRRSLLAGALSSGADAFLLEPIDPRELSALAAGLLARRTPDAESPSDPTVVGRLAGEVAHAVNNPLQVLGLLLESEPAPGASAPPELVAGVSRELKRIREAVEILTLYARRSPPAKTKASLGVLLAERLDAAAAAGLLREVGPPPRPDVDAAIDPVQVRHAVDALLRFLAARAADRPVPVRGIARRGRAAGGEQAEAAVRARGVHFPAGEWDDLANSVLLTDDRTRTSYPGLALPRVVAEGHGGALTFRETAPGTVVALRFPRG